MLNSSAVQPHPELLQGQAAFDTIYTSLSPIIYGITLRVARDKYLANNILSGVFHCFNKKGLLTTNKPISPRIFLPILFKCVEDALSGHLPDGEIKERIAKESRNLREAQMLSQRGKMD